MTQLFKSFQDYIAQLCREHITVQHGLNGRKSFFRMDGEEAPAAIPNNAAAPYVIINGFTGKLQGQDYPKLEQDVSILFLSKVKAQAENRANETERVMQEAYNIMMDFLNRIMKEYEEDNGCGWIQYLQPDRIGFTPVGPVNQLEYGWNLTFPFVTGLPAYNAGVWTL